MLLHLARLTDPERVAGRETLTIRRLPAVVPEMLRLDVRTLVATAKTACEPVRPWRNRRLAHTDFESAISNALIPGITDTQLEVALASLRALLNRIEDHFWPSLSAGRPVRERPQRLASPLPAVGVFRADPPARGPRPAACLRATVHAGAPPPGKDLALNTASVLRVLGAIMPPPDAKSRVSRGGSFGVLQERLPDMPEDRIVDLVGELNDLRLTKLTNLKTVLNNPHSTSPTILPFGRRFIAFLEAK